MKCVFIYFYSIYLLDGIYAVVKRVELGLYVLIWIYIKIIMSNQKGKSSHVIILM